LKKVGVALVFAMAINQIHRQEKEYYPDPIQPFNKGWKNWKVEDFTYCLDVVAREFGMNRLMYGSDWPVSLLASNYQESIGIAQRYFAAFSEADQEKFWGANAIHFYNL
jgi:predicted TIM-barrel fold metal-dependent hydrolase